MFASNLDFLMNLTGTSSSALGNACFLNPSYVSRLRSGSRPLPKKPAFLPDMCSYLARQVSDAYQCAALCDAMNLHTWPANEDAAAELIQKWLLGGDSGPADPSALLAGLLSDPAPAQSEAVRPSEPKSYYYGPAGKREAVLQFFDLILREKKPQTLLLFSEEEMSWLYEDPSFAQQWTRRFSEVLAAGNRVKIIHKVGRTINEMLEAISKWLPIYANGQVEPYYCPKIRDGIFQRTLFLAPGTAAVSSVSVGEQSEGYLNELITDKEALVALAKEYMHYLALCRPLMQILTRANRSDLWNACSALLAASGDTICMSDRPTLVTMPQHVAKAMQERAPENLIYKLWQNVNSLIVKRKDGARYTEILPDTAAERPAALPFADLLDASDLTYTEKEWAAHLKAADRFPERHPGYTQFCHSGIPRNTLLLAKEGRAVIMIKTDAPSAAFAFTEDSMVDSFWNYLNRLT